MKNALFFFTLALVLSCAGSTTTFRAEGPNGLAAEVTYSQAQKVCEPGEAWDSCIPKCAAASSATEAAP